MNIVIQCAGSKRVDAGRMQRKDGTPVMFVAEPAQAPDAQHVYFRPDDLGDEGKSWRETLLEYNESSEKNPWGLVRAADLYRPAAYIELVNRFGFDKVFILSAGWGLVRGDFRLPAYDITFSGQAEKYKRRPRTANWADFNDLPFDTLEPVVFLGGKDYLPLFNRLSSSVWGPRLVFYNSDIPPYAAGCGLHRYQTSVRTNWHYSCARDLVQGHLDPLFLSTAPRTD